MPSVPRMYNAGTKSGFYCSVCAAYSVVLLVSKQWNSKVTVAIADTKEEFLYLWSATEILRFAKK